MYIYTNIHISSLNVHNEIDSIQKSKLSEATLLETVSLMNICLSIYILL
jgi:hypothetical protein